ncbi:hypothetical protein QLS71_002655 [Mariniflexile litorale]|uniref:Uncharacterized protein n=1 Tax=Mariniflexile litorale TaxID=3045158 RepID=A0AAU7EHH2_9FLAO|nr:hypothetical protein [Mariniflexile sp. KMM 9835]MDQ8209919.1 hypothetical protein [Mariniflexile sp. KMM 9835]
MDKYALFQERLIKNSSKNKFKGIDPYDFASSNIKMPHALLSKVSFINKISPINLRPLLKIEPSENTKSNAIFFHAMALMDSNRYAEEIKFLKNWLQDSKSPEFKYYSLGFAFEMALTRYNSGPGKTSLIISLFAMFAFFEYYKVSKDQSALELICSFEQLLEEKWLKFEEENTLWYSYLPHQKDEVYNATAKVGRFYALYYEIYPSKAIESKIIKILNYLEKVQSLDGSWGYSVKNGYVDNFHTAFVLESIHHMHQVVKTQNSTEMFENGLADYIENCFKDNIPLHFHKLHYPKDVRSKLIYTEIRDIANAIILFSKVGMLHKAETILNYSIHKYYNQKEGYFYFFNNKIYKSKINYVRWQAWMALAITEFSNKKVNEKN